MTKELKRFEQWWDAEDDIPNNGPYTPDTPIQFAWAGWQAALAEQPAYRAVKTYHEGKPVYVAEQPAVPDAIHHTDLGETLEYIQGWNDCRQLMMEMLRREIK